MTTRATPRSDRILNLAERLRLSPEILTSSAPANPLEQAVPRLCLCTEPHTWGGTCGGPAPAGTPIDSILAAAIARALCSADDPTSQLEDCEGEPFPDGERQGYLLDQADFDFYLATLARALTRSAAA